MSRTFWIAMLWIAGFAASVGAEEKAEEKIIDIEFGGGSLKSLIQTIKMEHDPNFNVVLTDEANDLDLPRFHLKSVSVKGVFTALERLLGDELGMRIDTCDDNRILIIRTRRSGGPGARAQKPVTKIFHIEKLMLNHRIDDVVTAVETAWVMGEGSQPTRARLKYHENTKLLIVVGTPSELQVVENVLSELGSGSTKEVERLEAQVRHLEAALGELRLRCAELSKQNVDLERALAAAGREREDNQGSGSEDPPPISERLEGTVVGTSANVNLIVINIGESDGVKVGQKFSVYRGNSFLAHLVIERVYAKQAAGRVVPETSLDRIAQGDRVAGTK